MFAKELFYRTYWAVTKPMNEYFSHKAVKSFVGRFQEYYGTTFNSPFSPELIAFNGVFLTRMEI